MTCKMIRFFTVLVALAVISLGCSEESSSQKPAPKPKKKVTAPAPAETEVEVSPEEAKVEEEFVYDPSGRRDPFEALLAVRKPIAETAVPLTPLQEYDLGQFRLIGAIIGKGSPKAMVEAPGGKPFMLKEGVKIGKNNGVVKQITATEVVVEEKFYDFSGAVRTSINKITFPPREGVN